MCLPRRWSESLELICIRHTSRFPIPFYVFPVFDWCRLSVFRTSRLFKLSPSCCAFPLCEVCVLPTPNLPPLSRLLFLISDPALPSSLLLCLVLIIPTSLLTPLLINTLSDYSPSYLCLSLFVTVSLLLLNVCVISPPSPASLASSASVWAPYLPLIPPPPVAVFSFILSTCFCWLVNR